MVMCERLRETELFRGLPEELLACIGELCQEVSFSAGVTIFSSGRRADRIYILQDGTVGLVVHPTSLPDPMTIGLLKTSGLTFGWSSVVGSGYYTAAAEAVTDVRAISLDGPALIACLQDHPCEGFEVMRRIAAVVSQRLSTIRTLLLETVCD